MNPVRIVLDIPQYFVPQARYAFHFLSAAWGLPVSMTWDLEAAADAHIVYTARETGLRRGSPLVIPFHSDMYEAMTDCRPVPLDGRVIWSRAGGHRDRADLIGSTFRLLTLADEQQIPPGGRDGLGNFLTTSLSDGRLGSLAIPLADNQAALLLDRLLENAPGLRDFILPRWPDGKTHAVCLTHDTDAVHLGNPREMWTNAAKGFLRWEPVHFNMVLSGLKHGLVPERNPFWGMPGWASFEEARGVKSGFFLSTPPLTCRRLLNDCKSSVFSAPSFWRDIRRLHGQGWEIGLHPALKAKDAPEELARAKQCLEERLESRIAGLRHHYLAIDNLHPDRTFRKQVEAGFAYDSSLGWQEKPGFRAGTTLPFAPYDPIRKTAFPLVELPLVLMDSTVMDSGMSAILEEGGNLAAAVREAGGVLMINWHTETWCNRYVYAGYRTALARLLEPLLADRQAWFATPAEIADWWRKRHEKLSAERPDRLALPAPA